MDGRMQSKFGTPDTNDAFRAKWSILRIRSSNEPVPIDTRGIAVHVVTALGEVSPADTRNTDSCLVELRHLRESGYDTRTRDHR